jgi:hypothetical protein
MPNPRERVPSTAPAVTFEARDGRAAVRQPRVGRPTGYRNGLPEPKRYVYRGTGVDIYAGRYGDEDLDRPV